MGHASPPGRGRGGLIIKDWNAQECDATEDATKSKRLTQKSEKKKI